MSNPTPAGPVQLEVCENPRTRIRKISRHAAKPKLLLLLLFCLSSLVALGQNTERTNQTPPPEQQVTNPRLPTLFVIGDSTANNNANGAQGWADPFISFFDATRINVLNRARAGRSSRTFFTEGLWDKVLQELKAGDFVLIQFGHNDGGPVDRDRARGSLPGIGEEAQEFTMPRGNKETVHTFGWYLRKFISDTKARKATPIILSLTVRNIWKEGKVERGSGQFGRWSRDVAAAEGVAFLDLTNIVADKYEALGEPQVQPLFAGDHTHTSPAGAELNAASVIAGLKGMKHCALCKYFSARAKEVVAYKPGKQIR